MRGLEGKVAVLTASTQGIGFAIAKRLAVEGVKVVVSSRKQDNVNSALEKLAEFSPNILGVKCHVSSASERKTLLSETIKKFGKLDILVSNAGVNPSFTHVLDCEESAWDKIFDVNLKSAFMLSKEALPYLRKSKGSSILYLSSIAAYVPYKLFGAYGVSKTGLVSLAKSAAYQLGPEGIRVNCLAPGIIRTPFSKILTENRAIKEEMLLKIPLNRFGNEDEMGGVAAFLCSDDASYITGECVLATGGAHSRL